MPKKKNTAPQASNFDIMMVRADDLLLDEENPRLAMIDVGKSQPDIVGLLWREFAVEEVALSIAHNGFFPYEPLFVQEHKSRAGKWVVVEGNRRLAAVMLLRDADLRRKVGATNLPALTRTQLRGLDELPVVRCERDKIWEYLGFRHINGPQAWTSESKAQYIAHVRNVIGIPLDKISETIGDTNRTVERLYRAQMILEQAEAMRVFDRKDRAREHFSFSHLYTGIGYEGIQKFIGISDDDAESTTPVPKSKKTELEDLLTWMYGSKSKGKAQLVKSQNPDLRILDATIRTKGGVVALRRGAALEVARDVAKGDRTVFQEKLQEAKTALQFSFGLVITGYDGDPGLLEQAREVRKLSGELVSQMEKRATDRK